MKKWISLAVVAIGVAGCGSVPYRATFHGPVVPAEGEELAVNQAVKSIAIAREYLVEDAWDLAVTPSFEHIDIDGAERTAIKFVCHRKARATANDTQAPGSP